MKPQSSTQKAPQLKIRSIVVKTLTVQGKTVYRHFFEWHSRGNLDQCYLRMLLIRQDGSKIGNWHNLKFPKVKLLGNVEVTEYGQKIIKPNYDKPTHFFVDADEIAAGYDYFTATLTKTSDPIVGAISTQREDLTQYEEKE